MNKEDFKISFIRKFESILNQVTRDDEVNENFSEFVPATKLRSNFRSHLNRLVQYFLNFVFCFITAYCDVATTNMRNQQISKLEKGIEEKQTKTIAKATVPKCSDSTLTKSNIA